MPSIKEILQLSLSLGSFSATSPESVAITSTATGNQLIGYFAGWTASLAFLNGCNDGVTGSTVVPLTVFSTRQTTVTCASLKAQVQDYKNSDDVFEESFLQVVYVQGGSHYEQGISKCLREAFGTEIILSNVGTREGFIVEPIGTVPNGPYVAQLNSTTAILGPVYRVFRDDHMAFMNGLLPNGSTKSYRYANVNTMSDSTIGIPVPSRLYFKGARTDAKPFEGMRVTVKDIIDVAGVKTSQGNRAWFDLYGPKNASAPAIQSLIDMGAVLIGKTKTAQFANSDRPTADWVDYHDAFNPRGDGYQDPGVSSAGAGAATAAYDWVDVSIATDTGGSIRIPAAKNGVFGLRPSFGALSNVGVLKEGEFFDAVGYHTRSPYVLRDFGKAWLSKSAQLTAGHTRYPRKIIMPSHLWPVANNASQAIFENWVSKLAGFLNASVEYNSIDSYWNATAHAQHPDTDFWSYMRMVGFHLIWKNQLDKVISPFRQAYAAAFNGRSPFINPFPAARYLTALDTTQEDYNTSYQRFTYFRDWFGKTVVKPDESACSESLFLIPLSSGDQVYRNSVYSPVNVSSWASFTPYYFSVQSQGPEVVLPIGEISYLSNITHVQEKLPVVVDILAHRNCDLMLLDLVSALADANLLKEVRTGRTLW